MWPLSSSVSPAMKQLRDSSRMTAIHRYDSLLSTITAYFSAEEGASEESIREFVNHLNEHPELRDSLRLEIERSLKDSEVSWMAELWAEYCHVFDANSEDEAREWVTRNVLSLVKQAGGQPV